MKCFAYYTFQGNEFRAYAIPPMIDITPRPSPEKETSKSNSESQGLSTPDATASSKTGASAKKGFWTSMFAKLRSLFGL